MKVAIVDDDAVYRFVIKTLLSKIPEITEINLYEDGETMIQALQSYPDAEFPDVVMVDINMNVISGWAVLDALQKRKETLQKKVHAFVVSSSLLSDDIEAAREHPVGLSGFLIKPMGMDKISGAFSRLDEGFIVV
jgi:two-component system, chemotaxis family, chemotaxis protein CheY